MWQYIKGIKMLCKSKKALIKCSKATNPLYTLWLDDHNGISYTWGPKIVVPCIIILSDILDQIMGCVASSSISVIQTGVIRYELKLLHMWYSETIFSKMKTCSPIFQPWLFGMILTQSSICQPQDILKWSITFGGNWTW